MALKGSLKDFSLPDLFQLLNFSKKNGTLNLLRGNARGYVCFRNGEVFFATTNWKRKPLGVKLLQVGIVTKAQVDEALELQRTTARGQRLGQLLIRLGYLTKDKLELFVQEQIQDAVFELLRWTEGEFEFQPGVVFPEEDIGLSISTEELIMEGSRRLDEWNRIEKKIPDLDVIFKMKSMNERLAAQISLTPEEWMVLTFVDGERTVKDIVDMAGMGTLQTCKIVYGLISSGLLENVSPDKTDAKVEQELERMAEELMQLEEKADVKPVFPAPSEEELAPIVAEEPEVDFTAAEEAPPTKPVREVSKTTLLEQVQELMVEVGTPVSEETEPEAAAEIGEEVVEEIEEETVEASPAMEKVVAVEPEESFAEAMEVEIEEDMEGEILIEEIPVDEEIIGIEEAEEVEGIEEISEEIAEDVLAEEEEAETQVPEEAVVAELPVVEEPIAVEEPVVELEDLVAEAAEQVVDFGMVEQAVDVTALTEQAASEPLGQVEELEADMLSDVLETEEEAEAPAGVEGALEEIPLEGLGDLPGVGKKLLEEIEAEETSAISEMRGATLEDSQEAVAEIKLGEKEEELNILKEKIISLLPEGMGLGEKEEEAPGADAAAGEKQPPSYHHKSITEESIEAQAAKRAYLEKRYGKIGKLADQESPAEMEPEEIPMEWSGHLDRISHRHEAEDDLVGGLPSGKAEIGVPGGRGIDPTKILGAAFRGGEQGEEEGENVYGENVVSLKRPTGSISIEKLVEELGPDMAESLRDRMGDTEASVAMAERTSRDYGTGTIEDEEALEGTGIAEGHPRAAGFTSTRDPIELLEEEMLEDVGEEAEPLEPAVAAPASVTEEAEQAGAEKAKAPVIDDTFLRIEELEMDMLEGVIEEDLVELETAADAATRLEEVTEPMEEARVPVEVGATAAGAPSESLSIKELEDDMLVDYEAGEAISGAAPAVEEAEEKVARLPEELEGLEGLEDDLAALEKELFSGEEIALEEDILTDIEEIEKSLAEEETAEEVPEPAVVLEESEPAAPAVTGPSETEMMEQFMEAAEVTEEAPERAVVFEEPEPAAQPSELDMLEHLMGAPEVAEAPSAPTVSPEPSPYAAPAPYDMDMLEHLLEAPETVEEETPVATGPQPSELDMLERIIDMPEAVEEAEAPTAPQAGELDMLENLLGATETVEEAPAPAAPQTTEMELELLERSLEAPPVAAAPMPEPVAPAATVPTPVPAMEAPPVAAAPMPEPELEAPPVAAAPMPEPVAPAATVPTPVPPMEAPPVAAAPMPEPVAPAATVPTPVPPMEAPPVAAAPRPEPVAPAATVPTPVPPIEAPPVAAAPRPTAAPRAVARPSAAAGAPPTANIPEVKEDVVPKTLEEPQVAATASPAMEQALEFEEAAPGGQKSYDTGSFSLERELAELTGAGAPQPTKKIKIPVKPGTPVKEGESPMQEMAKGKPVPKVKRDKTVTKGIIVRIIDGIKKL